MAIQDGSCETAGLESSSSKAVTAGPSFASSCGAGVRGSQESCEGPSHGLSVRYDMARLPHCGFGCCSGWQGRTRCLRSPCRPSGWFGCDVAFSTRLGGRDGLPGWTCELYGHSHCLSGLAAVCCSDEGAQAAVAAGVDLCISMEAVGFATAEVRHDTVSAGQD